MRVVVKLFATAREAAGVAEVELEVGGGVAGEVAGEITVAQVADQLAERYPRLKPLLPKVAFAVNREYAPATVVVRDGDELAVLPPVSGG